MDKIIMLLRRENEIKYQEFENLDYTIEVFTDVILGLQAIKSLKPRLIVIDLATSRISGLDLIKIIRSTPKNYQTKIIVTAKYFNFKILDLAFANGADYFLKYPFGFKELNNIYLNLKYFNSFNNIENIISMDSYSLSREV